MLDLSGVAVKILQRFCMTVGAVHVFLNTFYYTPPRIFCCCIYKYILKLSAGARMRGAAATKNSNI